jgi:hypothetical protein
LKNYFIIFCNLLDNKPIKNGENPKNLVSKKTKNEIMLEIENPKSGKKIQLADNDLDKKMDWYSAQIVCSELGEGWRLPSLAELEIIFNEIHQQGIGNFQPDYYWSSNPAGFDETAWYYWFKFKGFSHYVAKSNVYNIRLVREI